MKRSSFLQITDDRMINLDHVANISLDAERDKVIFGMDFTNECDGKTVTNFISVQGIDAINSTLKDNLYFNEHFFSKSLTQNRGYINFEKISSVKYEASRKRVIINLTNSNTLADPKRGEVLVTAFIYLNFKTDAEYAAYLKYLEQIL